MKNLIPAALLLLTTSLSFAGDYDKFVCQEYDRATEQLLQNTIVLSQTGEGKDKLNDQGEYIGYELPYSLELYEGLDVFPEFSAKGLVLTEDVYFGFEGKDKKGQKVNFTIYLDEMEEAGLVRIADGNEVFSDYICRF